MAELYQTYYGWACEYTYATQAPDPVDQVIAAAGTPEASPIVRAIRWALQVEEQLWEAAGARRPAHFTPGVKLTAGELEPLQKHANTVRNFLRTVYLINAAQVVDEMAGELARVRCQLRPQFAGPGIDATQLNDTESLILETLGNKSLKGEDLAKEAKLVFNSNLKSALSGLVKCGILRNERGRGYYRPES